MPPSKRLLKTLLKELFTNKEEILSCESVKPCKNRKNSRACYARTRDKSGSNSPPFKRNVQIPPFPGTMHSQLPGVCPGGCRSFELIGALLMIDIHRKHIWPLGKILEGLVLKKTVVTLCPISPARENKP